jgi:NAD(P)-dependent dehydrogenase (short-subunit alcohol dehydrogenase family)
MFQPAPPNLPRPAPAAATPAPAELQQCIQVLEALAADPRLMDQLSQADRIRLLMAAGRAVRPDKHDVRRRLKAHRRERREAKRLADRAAVATTAIRVARLDSFFVAPPRRIAAPDGGSVPPAPGAELPPHAAAGVPLREPRDCYVCKADYVTLHHFYDSMCPKCADFNYEKRFQTARLDGRVAVITGARLKIGYQAALMLLRAGARVVVTTRFPQDAALRYAREADFRDWSDRLAIYGLDLRHSPSVEAFTRHLDQTLGRLDFLINNAAQTVRRPPGFYAHLIATEDTPHAQLPPAARKLLRAHEAFKAALLSGGAPGAGAPADADGSTWISEWHSGRLLPAPGVVASARLSQVPYRCDEVAGQDPAVFPAGRLDADRQQVDLRAMNSWRMRLADVPTAELLEVQLVNSIAPFILCSKLKPLMMRDRTGDKHIVNVSAMEGKFSRHTKTDKHPHTNMAKAALNMMTLTSARDYAKDGIFMNAVDTGWVTDEDPAEISARKQRERDFQPPLDIVDGAARVMDPIFSGLLTGKHAWGCFLKDYFPTDW